MDMLIKASFDFPNAFSERYTDTREDERKRKISLKSMPMSIALPSSTGKTFLLNLIDTPGHPNFIDEVGSALRLCDGAILVIDCIEGVTLSTETLI